MYPRVWKSIDTWMGRGYDSMDSLKGRNSEIRT